MSNELASGARDGNLFIVAAPSGGGKTSLVNALLQSDPQLALSISHTTRPPRPAELDGQHYHFVSVEAFNELLESGEFLEHARVFDNFYATSRQAVASRFNDGKDVILDIDWQGARQVRQAFPDCCAIFIIPPSLQTLHDRLTSRGQDSSATVQTRMLQAQAEISHWREFDQLVVNDDFDTAIKELSDIISDHRLKKPHLPNKDNQYLAQRLGRS